MVLCEAPERFEVAERICMERGSTMIPPYDDYDVMAGRGLWAWTDGTVSGAFHSHRSGQRRRTHRRRFCGGEIRVGSYKGIRGGAVGPSAVHGEPEGRGTGAGAHEEALADALVSQRPGLKNFPVVKAYVDGFASVDDPFMLKGMELLLMEGKVLAERRPVSGSAPF